MKLYHGTAAVAVPKILAEGILPRSRQVGLPNGNWDHTVTSNPHCVYLTSVYAPYFAYGATSGNEPWAILEVDTNACEEPFFLPDEDWLEQSSRGLPIKGLDGTVPPNNFKARTLWFRERAWWWHGLWEESLNHMGTCGYRGRIRPEAITRIAYYIPNSNPAMTSMALDPQITPLNFTFMKDRYATLTRWFFRDPVIAEEFFDPIPALPQQMEALANCLDQRDGLFVTGREAPPDAFYEYREAS